MESVRRIQIQAENFCGHLTSVSERKAIELILQEYVNSLNKLGWVGNQSNDNITELKIIIAWRNGAVRCILV